MSPTVTPRSADAAVTVVVAVAVSSPGVVSVPESVATVAVLVSVVSAGVAESTCTSTTKLAFAPGAKEPMVQVTSPASWPHDQPGAGVTPR